ncbi:MAG: hypothetical protein Q9182_004256 [Xanthomendoza sp. 2 TL-2023]
MKLSCSALLLACTSPVPVLSHPPIVEHGNLGALQPRQNQKNHCEDLNAPIVPECWDVLQLGPYVQKYLNSTPGCGPGEWWATCFIRLGSKHNHAACNLVTSTDCSPELDALAPNLHPSIQPKVRYVLATIQQIHSLFTELARSVKRVDASDPVLLKLRTNPLNLTGNLDTPPGDYRTALSLGVPFIGARTTTTNKYIGKTRISDDLFSLSARFLSALERTPRVTDRMYPSDSTGPADTDDVFSSGLQYLMVNARAFASFAKNGTWTNDEDFNKTLRANKGAGLSAAAATLHTTLGLRRNGFNVTVYALQSVTSFLQLPSNTPATSAGEGKKSCQSFDRDVGQVCTTNVPLLQNDSASLTQYRSGASGNVYGFNGILQLPNANATKILLDIYNNTYADITTMFDGGYNCTILGHAGALLGIYSDGTMDFQCFSSLSFTIPGRTIPQYVA